MNFRMMKRLMLGMAAILPSMAFAESMPVPAPGFHVSVFADHLPAAREIALGTHGTVFVGSRRAGNVYALTVDPAHPETVQRRYVIASGLDMPVGVAFQNGDLYISDVKRILVLRDIEHHLDAPPKPSIMADNLPWRSGDHDWKFIAFGPDDKLYVPVGAPCNICDVKQQFGKLMRMDADGTHWEDVAYGIRNTVGFTWEPHTGKLWFTDNGRDMLGDDVPSDELDILDKPRQNFGYPYCHQGDVPDPQFGKQHSCREFTPPIEKLGAHVAALGLRFYQGSMFPPAFKNSILIAEHGSWNRSEPSGYRVVATHMNNGRSAQSIVLLNMLTADDDVLGRPADVQPLPDGSVLVSDDHNGVLYRLTYGK
ncbi:sorbosone dehydrogenase [Kozakia baliensis]|nr:sorbosone dehydrogenase [Kozakia baliensis]